MAVDAPAVALIRGLLNWLAIATLGLAVSYSFANSPYFLQFGIQADTLYPALLAEDLRADPGAALRFRPSRIPSFVPDLLVTTGIDLLTGSWRLAFWFYGALAFTLLCGLGGWVGAEITRRRASDCALVLAVAVAVLLLFGLGVHLWASGERPMEVSDASLPVNLQILLMLPVWHGGGFIIGLGLVALAWRCGGRASPWALTALLVLGVIAAASNTITIAHAFLPAIIALADAAWRGTVSRRAALAAIATMALGAAGGAWLGHVSKRMELPLSPAGGWGDAAFAAITGLAGQPVMLAMLLTALPIALAFFRPRQAAALLPAGGQGAALRYFIVVAAASCGAALLLSLAFYGAPMGWRYGMPLAWWPLILAAAWLPARRMVMPAGVLVLGIVAAQGSSSPAIMRWQHPAAACLDAADRATEWRAGLAAFWHARTIAATSDWRRQVESTDFGDARPLLWIADPRSHVQQRHAAPGTPPPYRFLYMAGIDAAAVTTIHGPPERVLPCGDTPIWVFPANWEPLDRLIAMQDGLETQALATGRAICIPPHRLTPAGLAMDMPAGSFGLAMADAARLRVSDGGGAVLAEVAPDARITLARAARIRFTPLDAAPTTSLRIAPAGTEARACPG